MKLKIFKTLFFTFFLSESAFSNSVAFPEPISPSNISYVYRVKQWNLELLLSFSSFRGASAPAIFMAGDPLGIQDIFSGLNIKRVYADNVYVSCAFSKDYKDCEAVHIFIEADEENDHSGSRRDKSNLPLKYLFVKIYKNKTFDVKLIEDK
ncbi:hypothetical protein [Cellvibrio japonicus]|uniref:hypothetical protein n=1 Tax=Cellvibrio japonicus TaxID=155077 RepID=UPI00059F5DB3|nr:hypothetical protein [Cellvibrio japonicus]QEI12553.1 hypothetical protein FY117_10165 [Cellvibrio japonicus]QEI16127.1 hypothetical protein FY116_10170 [Cellvibrio japonicus]QEI19705.1 hypothetical protein FY115_10165 [Cellvibrio japonicus]